MSGQKPYFSKSKLIAAWQCQKKLYLDKHHPDLAEDSDDRQAIFDVGNRVGKMAQDKYGTKDSVEIPYNRDSSVMYHRYERVVSGWNQLPRVRGDL